jgi:hypothetical protein
MESSSLQSGHGFVMAWLLAACLAVPAAPASEWAVVNAPIAPLLDRPSVTAEARGLLYPGMRVEVLDSRSTPGYARVLHREAAGWMRARELLRGFIPEDRFPGPGDRTEPGFEHCDRDHDGIPDFRDIVYAARDMLGLPFDDAASLRLDDSGRTPDGMHLDWASDGLDNNGDGVIDDRDEDVMVCIDLLVRAVEQAGYPMSRAMRELAALRPELFREGTRGQASRDEFLTRRVRNVIAFTKNSPDFRYFPEPKIHSPTTWPSERARPGDLLFFGLTKDLGRPKFQVQHSGICVSVHPQTGQPVWMVTAVVPRVQFFNLQKGFGRFTYCGHARLLPLPTAPSVSATAPSSPSVAALAAGGVPALPMLGLPLWTMMGSPASRAAPSSLNPGAPPLDPLALAEGSPPAQTCFPRNDGARYTPR